MHAPVLTVEVLRQAVKFVEEFRMAHAPLQERDIPSVQQHS